jgi:hypothetical protein
MTIMKVRFGNDVLTTATPAASAMILAAIAAPVDRYTPSHEPIMNAYYEGDWDAEIESESAETVAHWVCRVWSDSSIVDDDERDRDQT